MVFFEVLKVSDENMEELNGKCNFLKKVSLGKLENNIPQLSSFRTFIWALCACWTMFAAIAGSVNWVFSSGHCDCLIWSLLTSYSQNALLQIIVSVGLSQLHNLLARCH